MLGRRLLIGAGNRLVDENTLFFNDGTDFTDQSSNNVSVSHVGNVKVKNVDGKNYWWFSDDATTRGFICFKKGNISIDFPNSDPKTIEFTINARTAPGYKTAVLNYGFSDTDYMLSISSLGSAGGKVVLYGMSGRDISGKYLLNIENYVDAYPINEDIHIAVEAYLENTNARKYSFYINGKYIGSKNITRTTGTTLENLFQYYIGTNSEDADNYFLYNSGVRNFRISNMRRYKEKDYTPYVDN